MRWSLALSAGLAWGVAVAGATDYYLGPAAGSQQGVALDSLSRLNALALRPGDRVFLQGGQTFTGTLVISSNDSGTADSPVRFGSFGEGRAIIRPTTGAGVYIHNASGIEVRDLEVSGPGSAVASSIGVEAVAAFSTSTRVSHLRLERMRIRGFRIGVDISGWNQGATSAHPGWQDVRLEDLEVLDNRAEGIVFWGNWQAGQTTPSYAHRDILIRRCLVAENRGDPTETGNTGSGIVLGQVDGARIEQCVARDNGGRGPTSGGGPFGIWVWDSRRVVIERNLVYNQRSSTGIDGGAFDLDGGARECVVQYNYSYNNEGPAIGLIQFEGAAAVADNIVRYNVSENDARGSTRQGVLYIGDWAGSHGINGAEIYGNTFYANASDSGRPPLAMVETTGQIRNIRLRNNLFMAGHSGALLAGARNQTGRALYQGNNYWGGQFDLGAFRSGGQERLNGSNVGLRADPKLQAAGAAGALTTIAALAEMHAYRLTADSPLRSAGVDLRALGLEPGAEDFFAQSLPSGRWAIGADGGGSAPASGGGDDEEDPPPSGGGGGGDDDDETPGGGDPDEEPPPAGGGGDGGGSGGGAPPPTGGRLVNLAARARSGTGDDRLIVGWSTQGEASLLVRGVGAGLAPLGVTGHLPDPRLEVYDAGGGDAGTNNNWGEGAARATVVDFTARVSALPLATADAAVARSFQSGNWTAHVLGNQRGVALAEIYRVGSSGGRLVNLAARAYAGTGDDTLIAGFVIADGGARILLRGLGPGLAALGVSGTLRDPKLQLYAGSTLRTENNNWGDSNAAAIRATGFAPPEGSRDAALLLNLPAGAYTVHLTGADGGVGVALLEIYLLD